MTSSQTVQTGNGNETRPAGRRLFIRLLCLMGERLWHRSRTKAREPRAGCVRWPLWDGGRLVTRFRPSRPIMSSNGHLVAISANLWHDWPFLRRMLDRLEAFARLVEIEGADLVLLQEVVRTPALHADEWLADRLGMAHVYSRANGHEIGIGFEEGPAVLSRFPITSALRRTLSSGAGPFVRRLALGAQAETPQGPVWVFSVHLSMARGSNKTQLADIRTWVPKVVRHRPAMIGGDFNASEHTPQICGAKKEWLDTYRALHPTGAGSTYEMRWPWGRILSRRRLDYLFLYPRDSCWEVLDARHAFGRNGHISDHRSVVVRMALSEARAAQGAGLG